MNFRYRNKAEQAQISSFLRLARNRKPLLFSCSPVDAFALLPRTNNLFLSLLFSLWSSGKCSLAQICVEQC